MRDLIISFLAVTLLIGSWMTFYGYSESRINEFSQTVSNIILPMVEEEDWAAGNSEITRLSDSWNNYKRLALLFLDTQSISEIDYTISKTTQYIKARDLSNSSGELLVLHKQLLYLSSNERVSLSNIL